MSSSQGPQNVPASAPGSGAPAKAEELVQHLDRVSGGPSASPSAAEGLAELMEWMGQEQHPAQTSKNVTAIDTEGEKRLALAPATLSEGGGYRGPTACSAAGITYRQLDYWARTGLLEPSLRLDANPGHGPRQLYTLRDVVLLKIVKRLVDIGVPLQTIRQTVSHLCSRRDTDLTALTLLFDGSTIHECSTPDEARELLHSGQGMFGIAVGQVVADVAEQLAELPGESLEGGGHLAGRQEDELARRRNRAG